MKRRKLLISLRTH